MNNRLLRATGGSHRDRQSRIAIETADCFCCKKNCYHWKKLRERFYTIGTKGMRINYFFLKLLLYRLLDFLPATVLRELLWSRGIFFVRMISKFIVAREHIFGGKGV